MKDETSGMTEARRATNLFRGAATQMRNVGVEDAAIISALMMAGIHESLECDGLEATVQWLRDVASEIELSAVAGHA